ncbi:MAG: FHA domain-containing protein [Spongiibacteraceae bacterium]
MFKLQFKHNPGRSMWLVGESIKLGIDKSNDLVLTGLGIADFHAEIIIEPNYLILKSKAGSCYVNGLPVAAEHKLAANDELRMGGEYMLVVDPKVDYAAVNNVSVKVEEDENISSSWALIPEHSQLKQRDFSIKQRSIIGRSKECTFFVPYKLLSREHAVLQVENGELWLEDMGSANGCFVNGARVERARLHDGDKVAFAKLSFTVQHCSPNKASVSKIKPADSNELKKTMIRPAIDMEAVLQRAEEDRRKALLTAENVAVTDEFIEATNNSYKKLLWLSAGLLVIVAGGFVLFG